MTMRLLSSVLALVLVVTCLVITPPTQATAATTNTGKATDEFNIVTFWPYHWENELTPEYFDTIKESGITTVEMNSSMNADVLTYENNLKAIQLAYERGLNVTVSEKDYNNSTWPEKTDAEIEAFVNRYINVPGVTGIYIEDEDGNAKRYAKAIAKIKSMMPNVITHVNFCNDYADNFKALYNELAKYGTGLMDYIMYDKYTFITPICDEQTLYYMLEYNRQLGEEYNLPTANYVQSMEINGGYRPNGSDIRYQVWAGLAYGLKQYSYFCYHTPPNTHETFGPAILDMDGNKTDLYDPVKELNWDVRTIGDTLMKLNTKVVYHTGTSFGDAYNALPSTHYLQPVDKNQNLTISRMQHQNGQEYGILVNRDYNYEQTVQFTLNGMKSIHLISTETGKPVIMTPDYNGVYSVDLLPGEGFLFAVGNDADYVNLGKAIKAAETVNLNKYKTAGKDTFQSALAAAKTVETNLQATQANINTAYSNLQNAHAALEMYAADGVNLALGRPVTATSSYEDGTNYSKNYLTDGVNVSVDQNTHIGWSVNPSDQLAQDDKVDIIIELADTYWIEGIVIKPALNNGGKNFPIDYTVSVSTDNDTWKKVGQGYGVEFNTAFDQNFAIDYVKAKYICVQITQHSNSTSSNGGYLSEIGEIEVYGSDVIAYGDMDGNGSVTISDAQHVLQAVVGKITFTEDQIVVADVDGNGYIDAGDALDILKKVVGKIKKFEVDR